MRWWIGLVLAVSAVAADADSMRCGKWIVNEQSTPAEILEKCGEPQDKNVIREDVRGRSATGGSFKVGVSIKEQWYYRRGTQSLPMMVTIVDGKVVSIERVE